MKVKKHNNRIEFSLTEKEYSAIENILLAGVSDREAYLAYYEDEDGTYKDISIAEKLMALVGKQ